MRPSAPDDEIAFFPPGDGGMTMHIVIQVRADFDLAPRWRSPDADGVGAVASFTGHVRGKAI